MELFERATRNKYRFESPQGLLSVEDLWDLPLASNKAGRANLDDIAQVLDKAIKSEGASGSFVIKNKAPDETKANMLKVVTTIIAIRMAEAESAEKAKATRDRNRRIMELIEKKQDQTLESATVEQLQAMLNQG
jgi:hypothetical protein